MLLVPTGRGPEASLINFRTLLGALLALFFALGRSWPFFKRFAVFLVALGWFVVHLGRILLTRNVFFEPPGRVLERPGLCF